MASKIEIIRNDADCIIIRQESEKFGERYTTFSPYDDAQPFVFESLEGALSHIESAKRYASVGRISKAEANAEGYEVIGSERYDNATYTYVVASFDTYEKAKSFCEQCERIAEEEGSFESKTYHVRAKKGGAQ